MKNTALALAGGLLLASSASIALAGNGARQFDLNVPLADINNPCTAGPDAIRGSVALHGVVHDAGGVTFLQVTARGSGTDAWGLGYQLGGKARFQFHDPLPADVLVSLRMISQGSTDNAFLVLAVHVNEQGTITQASYSGVECRG